MTEAPMTQQELNDVLQFFKDHNIAWLGAEGDANGVVFANYFGYWSDVQKREVKFTPENLALAFKEFQRSGTELHYYSPEETQYHLYEEKLGPQDSETIRKFLPTYTLSDEGDNLFVNFNQIASYCIRTGQPITQVNLRDRVIGNLRSSSPGASLRWRQQPLQDWEKEELRKAESAQKAAEAYKKYHQELDPKYQEEQRLKRQAEEIQNSNQSYWEQRTHSFINSIQSHVQRAEAETLFGKQKYGNWEVTFRELEGWHDRKKNQSAGHWY